MAFTEELRRDEQAGDGSQSVSLPGGFAKLLSRGEQLKTENAPSQEARRQTQEGRKMGIDFHAALLLGSGLRAPAVGVLSCSLRNAGTRHTTDGKWKRCGLAPDPDPNPAPVSVLGFVSPPHCPAVGGG